MVLAQELHFPVDLLGKVVLGELVGVRLNLRHIPRLRQSTANTLSNGSGVVAFNENTVEVLFNTVEVASGVQGNSGSPHDDASKGVIPKSPKLAATRAVAWA